MARWGREGAEEGDVGAGAGGRKSSLPMGRGTTSHHETPRNEATLLKPASVSLRALFPLLHPLQ